MHKMASLMICSRSHTQAKALVPSIGSAQGKEILDLDIEWRSPGKNLNQNAQRHDFDRFGAIHTRILISSVHRGTIVCGCILKHTTLKLY